MQLNEVTLVDRFNRPSVGGKVAIRTLFINDGEFIDPYDVSACTIFAKLSNASPSSIVDTDDGLIKSDATSVVLMNFGVSGGVAPDTHDGWSLDDTGAVRVTSNKLADTAWFPAYVPGPQASGIYRVGVGDYVAVLDGNISLSGGYNIRYPFNNGITVANAASSVQDYIDVWTVKLFDTSEYQLFINNFSLYNDTFTTITEPLLITTRNKLLNKKLRYGEKIDMKITTDITVQNSTLSEETKNILKDYQITNPKIMIKRVNDDSVNQPAWSNLFTADQDATTTTDNTILYTFDTDAPGNLGTGTFIIVAKYSYLTQDFVTPPFYFTIS